MLTFTRQKDTLHYKFIEELHGIKALLARLLRVDGAYLRFTGELSFEHYQADVLIETHRDESLWELMMMTLEQGCSHSYPTGWWINTKMKVLDVLANHLNHKTIDDTFQVVYQLTEKLSQIRQLNPLSLYDHLWWS